MKALYILLAIALIGVGVYWYQSMDDTGMESDMEDMMEDDMDMSDSMSDSDEMNDNDNNSDMTGDANASIEVDASVSVDADAKVFDLVGSNYEFDVSEITVTEGDTVTINFTSAGGFHDWTIDEFDAATDQISTGGSASVTFVADAAGSYEFYCSVGSHREMGMVGTLIVEPAS